MTDRELAEEYADRIAEEYRDVKSDGGGYVNIKEAFLAGLKEGQKNCNCVHTDNSKVIERLENQVPQWHDLRKDPNDLPDSERVVSLAVWGVEKPIFDFYRHSLKEWNYTPEGDAIAWCELPKFEEVVE